MIQQFDTAIFRFFNAFAGASDFTDATIRFCAVYLLYVMITVALLFFVVTLLPRFRAWRQKNINATLFIIYSAFMARVAIAEPIRWMWHRARPFEVLGEAHQLVAHPNGASFPSGHASLAFGIAAGVAYYYPKTSVIFFVAAFFVGFGRIAAAVHWPSDIIGGAIAGLVGAVLARRVMASYATPPPPFFHGTDESNG